MRLCQSSEGDVILHVFVRQIRLAEVEQASLMSEQMSDKSSLALPDDLSLDEHSMYQLLLPDPPVHTHTHTLLDILPAWLRLPPSFVAIKT